ncbi:hypothetical protein FQN57_006246 [Myotisia sp. PD_48]|nr:hypothetical protein FQN57_006246 [Myotisia sp. PD_48]
MAVVVDILPPRRSSLTDYMTTFTVKDSDFLSPSWTGLKIRYFAEEEESIPKPQEHDIIFLKGIDLGFRQGKLLGTCASMDNVPWIIWRKNTNPLASSPLVISKPQSRDPTRAENSYAAHLLSMVSTSPGQPSTQLSSIRKEPQHHNSRSFPADKHPPYSKPQKFSLIQDTRPGVFADLIGQVVKTFPEYDRFTLYVTDYTTHQELKNHQIPLGEDAARDGDEFNYIASRAAKEWPGPYGKMTMQVNLWEPHANYARNYAKVNSFVSLRNVHIKHDRRFGILEGAMHEDRIYPDKVQIEVLDENTADLRLKELVRRKLEYWKKLRKEKPSSVAGGVKRQRSSTEITETKSERKRQGPSKKKPKDNKQPEPLPPIVQVRRDELNTHVRATDQGTPYSLLRDILVQPDTHRITDSSGEAFNLPFQNLRYRACVRVVDFFPPNLEDFCVLVNPELAMIADEDSENDESTDDDVGLPDHQSRQKWDWRFCLLVEDGGPIAPPLEPGQKRERMPLYVSDVDAVFLLCMDPVNLREDPKALADLRERLFILWGDLEECKRKSGETFDAGDVSTVSAKPFPCCIKEYGVRVSTNDKDNACLDHEIRDDDTTPAGTFQSSEDFGWARKFRMFGTTII